MIETSKKMIIKQKNQGFTLLEMLVVLLIVTVLIILFIPNVTKQRSMISEKEKAGLTKVIETQVEMYYLENGNYPSDIATLSSHGYLSEEQVKKAEKYKIMELKIPQIDK